MRRFAVFILIAVVIAVEAMIFHRLVLVSDDPRGSVQFIVQADAYGKRGDKPELPSIGRFEKMLGSQRVMESALAHPALQSFRRVLGCAEDSKEAVAVFSSVIVGSMTLKQGSTKSDDVLLFELGFEHENPKLCEAVLTAVFRALASEIELQQEPAPDSEVVLLEARIKPGLKRQNSV